MSIIGKEAWAGLDSVVRRDKGLFCRMIVVRGREAGSEGCGGPRD